MMKKLIKITRGALTAVAKTIGKSLKMAATAAVLIAEDALILSGLGLIVYATFQWSRVAGLYAAGACLFGLGVWAARHPSRKKWKR